VGHDLLWAGSEAEAVMEAVNGIVFFRYILVLRGEIGKEISIQYGFKRS
jgi:hypothetical protein